MTKLVFEVQDAEIVEEESDNQFALAKIHAFSSGFNRHELTCDVDTLKRTAHTIYEKPVVFDYDPNWGDFTGHSEEPFIAGFVVPDSATFEDLNDGRVGLNVLAKIWKYYSKNFVEIFAKDSNHERKVSVEMELKELEENESTGVGKMMDFVYTAVAVLGTLVTEASPGAHMQMVSFSEASDKESYIRRFARYDDIDFTIPNTVKKNCLKGLKLAEELGGGTSVALATARFLSKNKTATPQRVRNMAKFFARNRGENLQNKASDEYIDWMLWGSNAGRKWSKSLDGEMTMADDKLAVYFEEEEIMPYSSMKDVNPAIKGIKPPVSLAQANAIARQADAIGSDDKKNGWAIAISNFKKNHKVKDGKWVKLESNSVEMDSGKEDATLENEKNNEEFANEEETQVEGQENFEEENKEEKEEKPANEEMQDEESEDEDKGEDEEDEADETNMAEDGIYAKADEVMGMLEGMEGFSIPENGTVTNDMLIPFMHQKMVAMSAELDELRTFKTERENEQVEFEVQSVIEEVQDVIPEEEITELMEQVSNFSVETLDGWKNIVRAKAFEYSKNKNDEGSGEETYVKYSLPFVGGGVEKSKGQPFS